MHNTESADEIKGTRSSAKGRLWRNILAHLRRNLLTGSLLLVPVALTYLVIRLIFDVVDGVLGPAIHSIFQRYGLDWDFPGSGVVVVVMLIYVAGFFLANALGRRLVKWIQAAVMRVPLVGTVYGAARKLVESFSGTGETGFKRVVLVQYPRSDAWSVGFLTGLTKTSEHEQLAVVYIPTSPFPNSGWVALVPVDQVLDTDISVPTAMQLIFSGGIVSPGGIKTSKLEGIASITGSSSGEV